MTNITKRQGVAKPPVAPRPLPVPRCGVCGAVRLDGGLYCGGAFCAVLTPVDEKRMTHPKTPNGSRKTRGATN